MSPDQIMMLVQTVAIVVQTILGTVAILIARREVKKWRTEALGNKKIELSIRIQKITLAVKDSFSSARNPFSFIGTNYAYMVNSPADEPKIFTARELVKMTLEPLRHRLDELTETTWELSGVLPEAKAIDTQVELLTAKYYELMWAVVFSYEESGSWVDQNNVRSAPILGRDNFGDEIEKIVSEIFQLTNHYTKS